jgi:hypothetical protein
LKLGRFLLCGLQKAKGKGILACLAYTLKKMRITEDIVLNPHLSGECHQCSLGRGVQIVVLDNCPSDQHGSLRSPVACL